MKTTYIKVDGAFADHGMQELIKLLALRWYILDKTIINDRYVLFILQEPIQLGEPDMVKYSYGNESNKLDSN